MLSCPRCQAGLFVGQASDITMHGCGQCGGLWLDSVAAVKVRQALPQDALDLAARATQFARERADTHAEALCPVCSRAMQRTATPAQGIDIDYCTHGTWFDRGELEQIASVLRQPLPGRPGAPPGYVGGPPPGYVGGRSLGPPNVALNAMAPVAPHVVYASGSDVAVSDGLELAVDGLGVVADIATSLALDAAANTAIDVAVTGASGLAEGAGSLLASGAAEAAASAVSEGAGVVAEGIFSLIGALFD
jgi:Zn-finger nucleic acid-binding protein